MVSPRLLLTLSLPVSVLSCAYLDPIELPLDTGPPCATDVDPAADRAACAFGPGAAARDTIACPASGSAIPIDHVIIVMQENRSFDHYLGHLPGHGQDDVDVASDGASNPLPAGVTHATGASSVVWNHVEDACFDNPDHSWAGSHLAWNQGRNDGFVIASSAGAGGDGEGHDPTGSRAMGYYDQRDIPFYYELASTFAIADRNFSDVLGPTLPNRLYLYAGTSFGIVDGTIDTDFHRTIFRALNQRGISWKVYQSDVAAGLLTASFLVDSIGHLATIDEFAEDARNDRLPAVSWVDAAFLTAKAGLTSEEPPADMQVGQAFVYRQVSALMSSRSWATSVMFITYDEAGGLYDHVPPPPACPPGDAPPAVRGELGGFDRYGFRVPLFVVSPFARPHFVSHVDRSPTSILRFIETRFGLPAMTGRDANADALLDMFDFGNPRFLSPPHLSEPAVDDAKLATCRARYGW